MSERQSFTHENGILHVHGITCEKPSHMHDWPTSGELMIERCEHYCLFCNGAKAKKRWNSAWFLRRHIRTAHVAHEFPKLQVVEGWEKRPSGNTRPVNKRRPPPGANRKRSKMVNNNQTSAAKKQTVGMPSQVSNVLTTPVMNSHSFDFNTSPALNNLTFDIHNNLIGDNFQTFEASARTQQPSAPMQHNQSSTFGDLNALPSNSTTEQMPIFQDRLMRALSQDLYGGRQQQEDINWSQQTSNHVAALPQIKQSEAFRTLPQIEQSETFDTLTQNQHAETFDTPAQVDTHDASLMGLLNGGDQDVYAGSYNMNDDFDFGDWLNPDALEFTNNNDLAVDDSYMPF